MYISAAYIIFLPFSHSALERVIKNYYHQLYNYGYELLLSQLVTWTNWPNVNGMSLSTRRSTGVSVMAAKDLKKQ